MEPEQTPFPTRWYGIELPGYREFGGTYSGVAYDLLPPLPWNLFHGEFQWLPEAPRSIKPVCGDTEGSRRDWLARLDELVVDAGQLGLALPPEFLRYMRTDLRYRVPSVTGCYYRWPDRIAESPKGDGGYLLAFDCDSQGCLLWYLYLNRTTSDHCVVVSWDFLGFNSDSEPQFPEEPDKVFFCSPSFESFIYRSWIENSIWIGLDKKRSLTPDEQAYAEDCKRHSRVGG